MSVLACMRLMYLPSLLTIRIFLFGHVQHDLTALAAAVQGGSVECFDLLLKAGADFHTAVPSVGLFRVGASAKSFAYCEI